MNREEAVIEVFREYSSEWNNSEEAASDVLAAADAHDAAHGIHRVSLDPLKHELFGAIYGATDKRDWAVSDVVDAVSAVLAAAVEADR